jgi:hypothetical protein
MRGAQPSSCARLDGTDAAGVPEDAPPAGAEGLSNGPGALRAGATSRCVARPGNASGMTGKAPDGRGAAQGVRVMRPINLGRH